MSEVHTGGLFLMSEAPLYLHVDPPDVVHALLVRRHQQLLAHLGRVGGNILRLNENYYTQVSY